MKKLSQIIAYAGVIGVTLSCSTQKNTVVSRNFHALTTKFNVLFNGEQAFEKGLNDINNNYQDNFYKRLSIEPISFDDRKIAAPKFNNPGSNFNKNQDKKPETPFDRAEEKAVKAIQKHSMNINGYEKNSQIDDAYLLLGKSRYYTQRFIPALEAFNYIIANYPNASLIAETKIWRAKTNVRIENEGLAIESLKFLLENEENEAVLSDRIKEQAHTAMAMAYEKTDTIQKVIEHLTKGSQTFVNKEQSARNMFILGQIYSELDRKDSARMVFQKLASHKKAPNKYKVHASIELAKNAKKDSTDVLLISKFRKLIKNTDNRAYYDQLFYQLGNLYRDRGNTEKAIQYYEKSLETSKNNYQKTYSYEGLGNLYFNKQNYVLAGTYYDSVLNITSEEFENEKRIRRIKRKNKGLTSLRAYESLIKENDSILNLVSMSKEEQTSYFEEYIEKIKKEDEERRQQLLNSQNFGSQFGGGLSFNTNKNKGKWYFYNTQSKAFGEAEFERIWGNRALEDNWRNSDKASAKETEESIVNTEENQSRYKVETYLATIPTNAKDIEKLKEDRADALYKLGLIYKEQFTNYPEALKNLDRLLTLNKNKQLDLPIHYHLYQVYKNNDNEEKAEENKNYIITNYPNSQFAKIIKNPNDKLNENEEISEVQKKYKEFYYLYKAKKYEETVNQINNYNSSIVNSDLIAKFALLKALAIGKYKSKEEYKKSLEFVAFKFANREEGEKAEEIIKLLK